MMSMEQRPAELAGRWYPGSSAECDQMLKACPRTGEELPSARHGAIVPHAGWVFSGAVAFEALRALQETNPGADLVVVFGGHLGPRDPPRVMIEGAWETPYGPLPIASALAAEVSMALTADPETPAEYFDDNAVEVVMPMVKKLWPDAKVLTVGVPPTSDAGNVGKEVATLAKQHGFEKPVFVGSTDLTHYGPNYRFNPHGRGRAGLEWVKTKNDPEIVEQMQALDAKKVLWMAQRQQNACCPGAAAACIVAAKLRGADKGVTTEYTTSYDVKPMEPEPMSFVGYVGMILGA